MSNNGLIRILLNSDPGTNPPVGRIFVWPEVIGLDTVLRYRDENGVVGNIGTSGTLQTHDHSDGANGGQITDSALSSPVGITKGGSGQSTQQGAINALTDVATATNETVLTKDTATGDAVWKAASVGGDIGITNEIYVNKGGNDTGANGTFSKSFLTVTAALTYIGTLSPSISNPIALKVGPGIFSEGVCIIPEYVSLIGDGDRTIISASNPSSDLILMKQNSTIRSISLSGVTGASNYLINVSGTASGILLINDVSLLNSSNGIITSNTTGHIDCIIQSILSTTLTGIHITGGNLCHNICINMQVVGNGTTTEAIKTTGTAIFDVFDSIFTSCAVGIRHESSLPIGLNSTNLTGCTTPIIKLTNSEIIFNGTSMIGSEAIVAEVQGLSGYQVDSTDTGKKLRIFDELSVGIPGQGRESALGEGDSYVNGMLVYTFDGITYTDVTTEAKSSTASTFTFPGLGIGNSIYLSTQRLSSGTSNPIKWYGFKTETVIASLGGEIVAEYWDGTSWIEVNHMTTQSSGKYLPFAKQIFQRVTPEHVRFDDNIGNSWQLNDPISLGTNLYWIRLRVITTITTAPVFEKFKIHTNSIEFGTDGFQESFGKSRPVNSLAIDSSIIKGAVLGPDKTEVYISQNIAFKGSDNMFLTGVRGQVGFTRPLPADVDTSTPITMRLYISSLGVSTVPMSWIIRWTNSFTGDIINYTSPSAPPTAIREQSIIKSITPPGDTSQSYLEFQLDISDMTTRRDLTPGDLLWISVERENDGNPDNAALIQVEILYTSWSRGGHNG